MPATDSIADAIEVAATAMALASIGRGVLRSEADERLVEAERAVIGAAARGELAANHLHLGVDLFGSPGRALAWLCAARACRVLGGRSSFFAARYLLVTTPRGGLPLDVFAALLREAEEELDAAEGAPPVAVEVLLAERRARTAREALLPVLVALEQGEALPDTAARLRDAARLFANRNRRAA